MTLGDLLERVSGLVAVEPAAPLAPAWRERAVTSVEYDSRRVTPGALFVALQGPEGRRRDVRAAGDREGRRRRDRRRASRRRAGRRRGSPWPTRAPRSPPAPRSSSVIPRRSARRRHHRHQRQDDDQLPRCRRSSTRPACAAAASAPCPTTSAASSATRRARRRKRPICSACCARWSASGCGACAAEVSSHALVLKRVDVHAVRRGDLHQPDPRPSRLPRRHGELLRRQAPAVRAAAADRAGLRSTSTTRTARELAAEPGRRITYGIDQPADVNAGPVRSVARRSGVRDSHAARRDRRALGAAGPAERLQHPRRDRGRRRRSTCRSARFSRASRRVDARARPLPASSRPAPTTSPSLVDYAHTDDALKNVLETVRPLARAG